MSDSQRRSQNRVPLSAVLMSPDPVTALIDQLQHKQQIKPDILSAILVQDLKQALIQATEPTSGQISYQTFCRTLNQCLYRRMFKADLPVNSLDMQLGNLITQGVTNPDLLIYNLVKLDLIRLGQDQNQFGSNVFRYLDTTLTPPRFRYLSLTIQNGQLMTINQDNPKQSEPLSELIKLAKASPKPILFFTKEVTYLFEFCLLNYLPLDDGVYLDYSEYERVYTAAKTLGWDRWLTIYPYCRPDQGYAPQGPKISPYDVLYYYLATLGNL